MSNSIQNPAIQDLLTAQSATISKPQNKPEAGQFAAVLQDRLKVSGHAATRLASRNIQLDQAQWDRVMSGVDRAAQKGSKESLVLMDNVALLVSVKNRTVITAVDQANLKENVFTNIDSAVIV